MTERRPAKQNGFTLVEAIIAMVITGIVAGIVAVFMVLPIQGYFDSVRRAGMTDAADTALRRVAYELRSAVPNTVRVAGGNSSLEFVPARDGGRYRAQLTSLGAGDLLDSTAADTAFSVLGPNIDGENGDFLVVFNTGQAGLSVYEGCGGAAATNCRTLDADATAAGVSFANTVAYPPFDSPSQRFQIVPSTGPVSFTCEGVGTSGGNGTGTVRRYTGYGFAAAPPLAFPVTGNLLAEFVSACAFTYAPINAANGLVTLRLTIQRESESVSLVHQIHVDNAP